MDSPQSHFQIKPQPCRHAGFRLRVRPHGPVGLHGYMREGLKRELGEFSFRRAAPKERLPVVLTREECRRLKAEF